VEIYATVINGRRRSDPRHCYSTCPYPKGVPNGEEAVRRIVKKQSEQVSL
jgi:hypothetical protein